MLNPLQFLAVVACGVLLTTYVSYLLTQEAFAIRAMSTVVGCPQLVVRLCRSGAISTTALSFMEEREVHVSQESLCATDILKTTEITCGN